MSGLPLWVPDTEHPTLYHPAPHTLILTDDTLYGGPRWSRFTQGPYVPGRGILTMQGTDRIRFTIYQRPTEQAPYKILSDDEVIAAAFNVLLIPETSTALHYYPGQCIQSIHSGLPMDTEAHLPAQVRLVLPRAVPINHDV